MRYIALSLAMSAVVAAIWFTRSGGSLPGDRGLTCDESVHRYGRLVLGDTIRHTFQVRNLSSTRQVVTSVWAACGCTQVELSIPAEGLAIDAGGTLNIPVLIHGEFPLGEQSRILSISTLDQRDVLSLGVRGEVVSQLDAPESIDFGSDLAEKLSPRTVPIRSARPDSTIEIKQAVCSVPELRISTQPDPSGGEIALTVSPTPELPSGEFCGYVLLQCEGNKPEDVFIRIQGAVLGNVTSVPPGWIVNGRQDAGEFRCDVVRKDDVSPLEILGVRLPQELSGAEVTIKGSQVAIRAPQGLQASIAACRRLIVSTSDGDLAVPLRQRGDH